MPTDTKSNDRIWYFTTLIKRLFAFLLAMAAIFILAGRINYWQGWLFGGIFIIGFSIVAIMYANKLDLAKERIKPGPGMKQWDKVFYAFYIPMYLAVIVVASLDAGRFLWTAQLPVSVYIISYIAHIFSYVIALWAMETNIFFSSVVRIQKDRGHKVVQEGPYRFVRHPAYIAGILSGVSTSLILGSLWALIPGGIIVPLFIIRAYLEDSILKKELPGYADYAEKVKYRLIPGIW